MDMHITATLSPDQLAQVQDSTKRIAKLERERLALIARMNRPHLVAARWLKMRLIWLFN